MALSLYCRQSMPMQRHRSHDHHHPHHGTSSSSLSSSSLLPRDAAAQLTPLVVLSAPLLRTSTSMMEDAAGGGSSDDDDGDDAHSSTLGSVIDDYTEAEQQQEQEQEQEQETYHDAVQDTPQLSPLGDGGGGSGGGISSGSLKGAATAGAGDSTPRGAHFNREEVETHMPRTSSSSSSPMSDELLDETPKSSLLPPSIPIPTSADAPPLSSSSFSSSSFSSQQPPAALASPWDQPIYSNPPSPTNIKPSVPPLSSVVIPLSNPAFLKSPAEGGIRKRGSLNRHSHNRRSVDRLSLELSRFDNLLLHHHNHHHHHSHHQLHQHEQQPPPASSHSHSHSHSHSPLVPPFPPPPFASASNKTDNAAEATTTSPPDSADSDGGAFWKQLKSRFSRKGREDASGKSILSPRSPPQYAAAAPAAIPSASSPSTTPLRFTSPITTLKSPFQSPAAVSLLKFQSAISSTSLTQGTSTPPQARFSQEGPRGSDGAVSAYSDPLFQALAPSFSPPASARDNQASDTMSSQARPCPARLSSDQPQPPSSATKRDSPPSAMRKSLDLSGGFSRSSSLHKSRRRSDSIRRKSLSMHVHRLLDPADLAQRLHESRTGAAEPILVLDLRPVHTFIASEQRLVDSINVNFPTLLVKRFRKGNFSSFALESFISNDESKQVFAHLVPDGNWQKHQICLVDDRIQDEDFLHAGPSTNLAPVLTVVLAKKQAESGITNPTVLCLRGDLQELLKQAADLDDSLIVHKSASNVRSGGTSPLGDEDISRTPRAPRSQMNNSPAASFGTLDTGRQRSAERANFALQPLSISNSNSKKLPSLVIDPSIGLAGSSDTAQTLQPPPTPGLKAGRKGRPIQLQRIDTSDSVKKAGEADRPATSRMPSGASLQSLNSSQIHASPRSRTSSNATPPTTSLEPPPAPLFDPSDKPRFAAPDSGSTAPFKVSVIIPGFLYLGPEPVEPEHAQELDTVGIKRVLNMATECNTQERWRGHFEKIATIPMRDSLAETNVQDRIKEACMLLDDADLHAKPTYVHCKAGKSRSVTIVLAYLIHRNHWPLKRAYAHVLDRRSGVSPNIGFVAELMRFEESELGSKSRGILGTGLTPAHEKGAFLNGKSNNKVASAGPLHSEDKLQDPKTPRSARSDLEGRPTFVRHLSLIASTAMSINPDKVKTRDQRSSTHLPRNRDSMPPGIGYPAYHSDPSYDDDDTDDTD